MIDSDIKERPSVHNSKWVKRLPAIFFLGAISYLFFRNQVYAAPKAVRLDTLHLQRLDGTELDAADLKGKAVVLNFWAPWCPPCRLEMPWLQKLQTTHPELKVVGVEDDADEYGNAIDFAQRAGISFLLVRNNQFVDDEFGRLPGLPTTLYLSPSGRVVHTITGVVPEAVMEHLARDAERSR
ncbi:MAG TPA: TlpA disulfide reductase family protein [Acidobacteriaceae bacterium]|nr:TlpA disulfide reductase family protein [Acidobacteriaceae bacterium]